MYKTPKKGFSTPYPSYSIIWQLQIRSFMYIVHEHKNVIALDKVDYKWSCSGTTDEIDEKCHTRPSDKGVKRASYFALKKAKPFSSSKDLGPHTVILEYFNIKNKHFLILPSSLSRYSSPKTKNFSNSMMHFWGP